MRPVLWLVPAFRCLIYELPPFHGIVSNISTYPSGSVVRHQRNIAVSLHPEEVAPRSENASLANLWSASNTLTSPYQAPGSGLEEKPDSDFLIFRDEDPQESELGHVTAVIAPQIGTARPSLHHRTAQIPERSHSPGNLVFEHAESTQLADLANAESRQAIDWTDAENSSVRHDRPPPAIYIHPEEPSEHTVAITRHNISQFFPSRNRRRPLPSVPIPARLLSPSPKTPIRSSSSALEDAFWAKSYSPRHVPFARTERGSITEPAFAPSVGHRTTSQSAPDSETLHHLHIPPEERLAATTAQHYEHLGQEATSDRVEILTSALLRGQRLRRSTDPELYCLTEAEDNDEHELPTSGPRYERPPNPQPPSPSANAQRIVHEQSLRPEPEIPSYADIWSSTPATDPHAPPIYLITAHEPGRASRRPFTSYYTFSAVPFNLNGRSALTTPVIDEFWADEEFHHAETIVGSPLFRGREDVERLDEALERIEVSLHGADFDLVGDDTDKENEYPNREKAPSDTPNDNAPSSYKYVGANKPKSGYELWKERQDRLKDEKDPEIRRKVLGEVAQILHERTKVRTRGLRDPFVRSHQEEADAEQERRYQQRNRAPALQTLTGSANSPVRSPSSQPSTTVRHRPTLMSAVAHRQTRTDPPRQSNSMVYSPLMHPSPLYPPGFFSIAFLNREWELRARTAPARRSEPAHQLSPETFHVINAPVQFKDDEQPPAHIPHTPEPQRMSTSMAMRIVEVGEDSPEPEDCLLAELLASIAAGEGS